VKPVYLVDTSVLRPQHRVSRKQHYFESIRCVLARTRPACVKLFASIAKRSFRHRPRLPICCCSNTFRRRHQWF